MLSANCSVQMPEGFAFRVNYLNFFSGLFVCLLPDFLGSKTQEFVVFFLSSGIYI